jgi:hypothetical protein
MQPSLEPPDGGGVDETQASSLTLTAVRGSGLTVTKIWLGVAALLTLMWLAAVVLA